MLDKIALGQVDTATLIQAALECAKQQADLLSEHGAMTEDSVGKFAELERVRAQIIHAIDWNGIDDVTRYQDQLQLLQELDTSNNQLLHDKHDELAQQMKLLKKRRGAAGEYLNFR